MVKPHPITPSIYSEPQELEASQASSQPGLQTTPWAHISSVSQIREKGSESTLSKSQSVKTGPQILIKVWIGISMLKCIPFVSEQKTTESGVFWADLNLSSYNGKTVSYFPSPVSTYFRHLSPLLYFHHPHSTSLKHLLVKRAHLWHLGMDLRQYFHFLEIGTFKSHSKLQICWCPPQVSNFSKQEEIGKDNSRSFVIDYQLFSGSVQLDIIS